VKFSALLRWNSVPLMAMSRGPRDIVKLGTPAAVSAAWALAGR
jgi:hypothetical protein